jgi:hypothetical protein
MIRRTGRRFLFPDVSESSAATERKEPGRRAKGLVNMVNPSVEAFNSKPFGANMTSISAASINSYQSPLQRLQDELQSEVNSGAISSSDQDALASALTDIDSSIQADRASDKANGTRPSPGDLKSKIDDLINDQVSGGKLTSDQATELQGIFKAAFAKGPGGAGRHGGPGGASGPPPGPPPSDDASATGSSDDSSGTSSISDILKQFLEALQKSQSTSDSSSYSSTGSSGTSASFTALLIDYQS